ncbi:iron uptake system protein EfeO [Alicyclobacillus contaminans]|uniref:iron uptake system protein EfeO n=1 Tax=Alicyclobacillus contaminans TaxID=392016 RepID=UPI00040FE6FE|nr:iron uptake system protein EfeO [Alicyclobacillus contaminans]
MRQMKWMALAISVSCLSLAGCSSNTGSSTNNTTHASNPTAMADLKNHVQAMQQTASQLTSVVNAKDTANASELAAKLYNQEWPSFENSVKSNYPLDYANVEKYLSPLFSAAKANPVAWSQVDTLNQGLQQALDQLLSDVEHKTPATTSANSTALAAAAQQYHDYVLQQSELLVTHTQAFVQAVEAGDMAKAESLYGPARVYYERIEPIAEDFGDLDPKIDARANDVPANQWGGFHELEQAIWVKHSLAGQATVAKQLLANVQTLQRKIESLTVQPGDVIAGAVDLLNEAATSKITGEEERYSHIDLLDLVANVDGSEKAFDAIQPIVQATDPSLAETVAQRFKTVENTMNKYKSGNGYVLYNKLTAQDTRTISEELNSAAEALSKTAKILS